MRKRIIAMFAIVSLFALAVAAYAYTRGTNVSATAACCCKKEGDSCPMMGKGTAGQKGERMSCCAKMGGDQAKAEGQGCCCCCSGDSCPMKKDGPAASSAEGESCCDNCDCCKDKATTAA